MGSSFKNGMFALAEVKYAAGDIKPTVIENATTSTTKVLLHVDNVAGVKVPVFTADTQGHDASTELIGMAKGGQQIVKAREAFSKAVEVLVKLATLQTSFITLDEAVKVTNRRVNALDCVVVPRLAATVAYINSELDELEREEFFRCAQRPLARPCAAATHTTQSSIARPRSRAPLDALLPAAPLASPPAPASSARRTRRRRSSPRRSSWRSSRRRPRACSSRGRMRTSSFEPAAQSRRWRRAGCARWRVAPVEPAAEVRSAVWEERGWCASLAAENLPLCRVTFSDCVLDLDPTIWRAACQHA